MRSLSARDTVIDEDSSTLHWLLTGISLTLTLELPEQLAPTGKPSQCNHVTHATCPISEGNTWCYMTLAGLSLNIEIGECKA
ncbi:hypothetical protein RRG08_000570 [Elysia crispata]|uniref:Uncharacterized protein n=1 Tax=Elysia crispata TaxID=231223 RepID=A0AAE0Y9W8_9GAST|nr:hypothetical protein RRG08_000570 [Elysia crispata]